MPLRRPPTSHIRSRRRWKQIWMRGWVRQVEEAAVFRRDTSRGTSDATNITEQLVGYARPGSTLNASQVRVAIGCGIWTQEILACEIDEHIATATVAPRDEMGE